MKNALALVCCLMGTVSVADTHKATFGGGCFWCLEPPFESIHGVSAVVSGYAGGSTSHPTYAEVTAGHTGHIEVVEVTWVYARSGAKATSRRYVDAVDVYSVV